MRFATRLDRIAPADYELVVASDGVHSAVREQFAEHFRPAFHTLRNRYVWYGTPQVFPTLSLMFREHDGGSFVAHAYRFSPTASTFIVECDAETWTRAGLASMSDMESRAFCERVFAAELDEHPLLSNRSAWTSFRILSNAQWRHRNLVLIGDALRTVHFSIGSGTRLAFEDAIALHAAIERTPTIDEALDAFEAARRPIVEKMTTAAANSYEWYEHFNDHMKLSPLEFAMSYVTRSGRVSRADLEKTSPQFLARYDAWRKT
jgi:anthraniloyl-CoA monooxygenase